MTLYNLFEGVQAGNTDSDSGGVSLGTEFWITGTEAWITQIRWLRGVNESSGGIRAGAVYRMNADGLGGTQIVGPVALPTGPLGGWSAYDLPTPMRITAAEGVWYKVVVFHPQGKYAATGQWFETGPNSSDIVRGPITIPNNAHAVSGRGQGTYAYDTNLSFPTNTFNSAAYFSDVTISDTDPSAAAAALVNFSRHDGSSFVAQAAKSKAWTGSVWKSVQGKHWTGTEWADLP